jgi:large subunit ribosomal protein L25
MATTVQLKGTVRSGKGKGAARKLRQKARIPGVLYGKGRDPVMLELDSREFIRAVANHAPSNIIVDLSVGAEAVVKTLIREVQLDPVSGSVVHVDLNQISLTDRIEVEVPIELQGVPTGVKNSGGILQHPHRTLALKCLPQEMPDAIRIDVTALEIGDSIHVSDLSLENLEILADPETSLASVIPPVKVEEVAPAAEEAEAEAGEEGEPEVVGEKKEEGEEGEKES